MPRSPSREKGGLRLLTEQPVSATAALVSQLNVIGTSADDRWATPSGVGWFRGAVLGDELDAPDDVVIEVVQLIRRHP